MKLTPHEIDKNLLNSIGFVAQKRLAMGIRLNIPEAVALLSTQIMTFARLGYSISKLMDIGRTMLGTKQVIPGMFCFLLSVAS
jgi:urease subunit gamma/beta